MITLLYNTIILYKQFIELYKIYKNIKLTCFILNLKLN